MSARRREDDLLREIASSFAAIKEVAAVVLSGSSASGYGDALSDYDFYIYSDQEIDHGVRRAIAEKYAAQFNLDNRFYETDDEWLLSGSGRPAEFIYRSREWIENELDRVWTKGCASLGYTTCFVYNVKHSRIYHDPQFWFRDLQMKTASPYPSLLRDNIIGKNMAMLHGRLNGSFYEQIASAAARGDDICVNHRIAVFLASYFDVLFAANEVLYPGEKKLLRYALDACRILPDSFEREVTALIRCANAEKKTHLDVMLKELETTLKRSGAVR